MLDWISNNPDTFKIRLTNLIDLDGIIVTKDDVWYPNINHPKEVKSKDVTRLKIITQDIKKNVDNWWLKHHRGANTPNWDFIGSFGNHKGLIIIEAKSHKNEAKIEGKSISSTSENSKENHIHISKAVEEANTYLNTISDEFKLSIDTHYQLVNRLAFAWKYASLGIPVILIYLGFINDDKMINNGKLFYEYKDWENFMNDYITDIFPKSLIGEKIDCGNSYFQFLIRSLESKDICYSQR